MPIVLQFILRWHIYMQCAKLNWFFSLSFLFTANYINMCCAHAAIVFAKLITSIISYISMQIHLRSSVFPTANIRGKWFMRMSLSYECKQWTSCKTKSFHSKILTLWTTAMQLILTVWLLFFPILRWNVITFNLCEWNPKANTTMNSRHISTKITFKKMDSFIFLVRI